MTKISVPTFVVNLKKRKDRKENIRAGFNGRDEFDLNIIEAHEHSCGGIGLWLTIQHIIKNLIDKSSQFIIICEDDHQFTTEYSKLCLFDSIKKAMNRNADILLGGVSWFSSSIKIGEGLFWVENFSGLQFTIIFRKFFDLILDSSIGRYNAADYRIASLTNDALFIYPFISIQKEFGYSDATPRNNRIGQVSGYFKWTIDKIKILKEVDDFYKTNTLHINCENVPYLDKITIPTYVINLPERHERLEHIKGQFKDRKEFDVTIVNACKHEIGAYGLWMSIRKIIQTAIENNEDVIIICEDDHQFTEYYSKEHLLRNILLAHSHGAGYLSGGTGRFGYTVPITENLFWVNYCLSAQFVVLYRKFFKSILDEPFNERVVADLLYSEMTSNKMILYPFISSQKDFGYSDVTDIHNKQKGIVNRLFEESNSRFRIIQNAYAKYKLK